jgi:hypothetical protein
MSGISPEAALAVTPFFVPLLIISGFLFFVLLRGQTQHEQRIARLEATPRWVAASPLASARRLPQPILPV